VIISRIFAVVAASLLVGAVALATLGPADLALAHGLYLLDHDVLTKLQSAQAHLPAWFWTWGVMPLLSRPVWLLPTALGLVCAGISATFVSRPTEQKRGWRS
jgi:hypothetical protein